MFFFFIIIPPFPVVVGTMYGCITSSTTVSPIFGAGKNSGAVEIQWGFGNSGQSLGAIVLPAGWTYLYTGVLQKESSSFRFHDNPFIILMLQPEGCFSHPSGKLHFVR